MCRDAAVTFRDFLQKYPFATDYDQYEWYLAYAWFSAGTSRRRRASTSRC